MRLATLLVVASVLAAGCTGGGGKAATKTAREQPTSADRGTSTTVPGDPAADPQVAAPVPAGTTTPPLSARELLRATRARHTRPLPLSVPVPTLANSPITPAPPAPAPGDPAGTVPVDDPKGPPQPLGPHTTQALLAFDFKEGAISYSDYVLYRTYALFWDPRLPARYDGLGSTGQDNVVSEARLRWSELTPAVQAAVAPFLERPDTSGLDCPAGWVTSGAASSTFKVWACNTGDPQADIDAVFPVLDDLHRKLADPAAMGPLVRDSGGPAAGGDDRIDVYLLDVPTTRQRAGQSEPIGGMAVAATSEADPAAAGTASSYLLFGRARMEDPDGFHRALIHQLFVSFEYAHNFAVTTVEPGRTPWFYEASAGWAEWELFRKGSTSLHQQYFASMFNSAPQLALEQPEGDLAPLADEQHAVRAYIWPFFMQQEAGGSPQPIYDAWKATDGVTSWPAFHAAIDAQRPFATSFQDFAVRNLNLDLGAATSPGYHDLDPNFAPGSTPGLTYDLFLERPQAADARALGGPGGPGLRPLSAEYDHVVVDPASGIRTLSLDFGGLSPASGAGVTVLTQAHDGTWARRDVAPGSRLDLCFDNAGDEIDQLYVIVGNHQRMTDFDTPAASSLAGSYTVAAAAAC